jgi:hypothetical protein
MFKNLGLDFSVFYRVKNAVIKSNEKNQTFSIQNHIEKSKHGLCNKPSNLFPLFETAKNLFKIFITRNRTPTRRNKKILFYMDPIFSRIKNEKNTPEEEKKKALTYRFQSFIKKLNEDGMYYFVLTLNIDLYNFH